MLREYIVNGLHFLLDEEDAARLNAIPADQAATPAPVKDEGAATPAPRRRGRPTAKA